MIMVPFESRKTTREPIHLTFSITILLVHQLLWPWIFYKVSYLTSGWGRAVPYGHCSNSTLYVVLPQSSRNMVLHFNALSHFVSHLWEHLPAYICQKCQEFFFFFNGKRLRGNSYKTFSLSESVWTELNCREPLQHILGLGFPFFPALWLNYFSFWLFCQAGNCSARLDWVVSKVSWKTQQEPPP